MTFDSTKGIFNQEHFTIIEIDVPVVEGVCTLNGEDGYGTPLTCDQPSDAIKTYKFVDVNAPLMPESGIFRCVKTVSETPTKLQSGKGLASRGTASIKLVDFTNQDPNQFAPAVTPEVRRQGTFFGKLNARNVLVNKQVRIKNYRLIDGEVDLSAAETRYYLVDSFSTGGKSEWSLTLKDELSLINIDEAVWPIPLEGYVRTDANETQTTINVDPDVTYSVNNCLRVGEEFLKISSVSGIGGGSASITIPTRGSDIVYTNTLTKVNSESFSAGDEIFVCEVSDNERIDDLLERIFLDIGVDASFIPKAEWAAEVDRWHENTRVNTIWFESESVNDVLSLILTTYLMDLWFDPVNRLIKLSAISTWKQSKTTVAEGNEININTLRVKDVESLRCTRASIVYDKRYLANPDDIASFKKAVIFKRTELETDDFYGKPKNKLFDNNLLADSTAASLLTNRWVSRYINPKQFSWTTPERKLDFSTGDIVDVISNTTVGFDGLPSGITRAQITSVKPKYSPSGREYNIDALTYEPVFLDDSSIVVTGNINRRNLYIDDAGAPADPVTLTIVFDAVTSSSLDSLLPSIELGAFKAGSVINILLINGTDLRAKGGNGGRGQGLYKDPKSARLPTVISPAQNGTKGGIVFRGTSGVTVNIYFSGSTGDAEYPTADGYIRAPNGGDGGFGGLAIFGEVISGRGGDGGDGKDVGIGGLTGEAGGDAEQGDDGRDGISTGTSFW